VAATQAEICFYTVLCLKNQRFVEERDGDWLHSCSENIVNICIFERVVCSVPTLYGPLPFFSAEPFSKLLSL
jgi:hypothetical protein